MKILHVIPGVPPRSGGPTNAIFGMVRALRAVGVEAEIATTDSDVGGNLSVPLRVKAIHEDAPIYYFRSPTLQKYGFSPELADWLRAHIKEYDLLHIHGIFAHSTLSAAAAARKIGIPYIIRPAGTLDPWPMRKNRLLKRTFLALIGWRILNQAAAIHATSEWEKEALGRLKVSPPLATVPSGTDPLLETDLPSPGEFRELYPESEQKKLILWLSRIDPIKGLDSLLTAMKQTKEKRNDFFLSSQGQVHHPMKGIFATGWLS